MTRGRRTVASVPWAPAGNPDGQRLDGRPATPSPIQSVERAARILGLFSPSKPRLSLTELTARLGANKATVHRYTQALRAASLLRYDPTTGMLSLGPQIIALGAAARAALPILNVAVPHVQQLVAQVGQTVVLSVWDGTAPVVVLVEQDPDRLVQISIRTGARLQPFHSAQGEVFCAYLAEGELPRDLDPAELERNRRAVRAEGLALRSVHEHGVRVVAAPVFDDSGGIAATMAVVGTLTTVPEPVGSSLAETLSARARDLSRDLGWYGPETATPENRKET